MRISERLHPDETSGSSPSFSLEVFLPDSDLGIAKLKARIERFSALEAAFIAIAGRGDETHVTRAIPLAQYSAKVMGIPALVYIACSELKTPENLRVILDALRGSGVRNLLFEEGAAAPQESNTSSTLSKALQTQSQKQQQLQQQEDGPALGIVESELVAAAGDSSSNRLTLLEALRIAKGSPQYGHYFCVGVPCRTHACIAASGSGSAAVAAGGGNASSIDEMKALQAAGAEFFLASHAYESDTFFTLRRLARRGGVTVPIVPSLLLHHNRETTTMLNQASGVPLTPALTALLEAGAANGPVSPSAVMPPPASSSSLPGALTTAATTAATTTNVLALVAQELYSGGRPSNSNSNNNSNNSSSSSAANGGGAASGGGSTSNGSTPHHHHHHQHSAGGPLRASSSSGMLFGLANNNAGNSASSISSNRSVVSSDGDGEGGEAAAAGKDKDKDREESFPVVHLLTLNLEAPVRRLLNDVGLLGPSAPSRRRLPWRASADEARACEDVRPIFWANRPASYVERTASWGSFPSGRWRSSANNLQQERAFESLSTIQQQHQQQLLQQQQHLSPSLYSQPLLGITTPATDGSAGTGDDARLTAGYTPIDSAAGIGMGMGMGMVAAGGSDGSSPAGIPTTATLGHDSAAMLLLRNGTPGSVGSLPNVLSSTSLTSMGTTTVAAAGSGSAGAGGAGAGAGGGGNAPAAAPSDILLGDGLTVEEKRAIWGECYSSERDVWEVFALYLEGKVSRLPWCEVPLLEETTPLTASLARLNRAGFLTINSQPRVNAASSDDPIHGWGGPGGYVYQKAYVECFCTPQHLQALVEASPRHPTVTFQAVDVKGDTVSNCKSSKAVSCLTWGVFPNREILQPTVVDADAFLYWAQEAFDLWISSWASAYADDSPAADILHSLHDTYFLVNVVDHDYIKGDIFGFFEDAAAILAEKQRKQEEEKAKQQATMQALLAQAHQAQAQAAHRGSNHHHNQHLTMTAFTPSPLSRMVKMDTAPSTAPSATVVSGGGDTALTAAGDSPTPAWLLHPSQSMVADAASASASPPSSSSSALPPKPPQHPTALAPRK